MSESQGPVERKALPVVKVVFLRSNAEHMAGIRALLSGPGLAAVDDDKLAVALDRTVAEHVEGRLRNRLRDAEFAFRASFVKAGSPRVRWPKVSLEGEFSTADTVSIPYALWGEVEEHVNQHNLHYLIRNYWMYSLRGDNLHENLMGTLHRLGVQDAVEVPSDPDEDEDPSA